MRFILLFVTLTNLLTSAQTVKIIESGSGISLRGLSVVDDKIIWASGNKGTVGLSLDSGISWQWLTVKGMEKIDFRDIEAFDGHTAIIMGVDTPSYILKTTDGGATWRLVYENKTPGMFLDAMDFTDERNGVVIGDPINKKFFIAETHDGGNAWSETPTPRNAVADAGEACFAASGTNIRMINKKKTCFVSGGLTSRMFFRGKKITLPILQGKESTGANSVALKNKKTFIIVGGDFNAPGSTLKNCVITTNRGRSWIAPGVPPNGYRSCVEYLGNKNWITCGLNGVDYSIDDGKTWQWIAKESFHVCRKAKTGTAVFFAGENGKVGQLQITTQQK
jgi:hypothetical protein